MTNSYVVFTGDPLGQAVVELIGLRFQVFVPGNKGIHTPEILNLHEGDEAFFPGAPGKPLLCIRLVPCYSHCGGSFLENAFPLLWIRDTAQCITELLSCLWRVELRLVSLA